MTKRQAFIMALDRFDDEVGKDGDLFELSVSSETYDGKSLIEVEFFARFWDENNILQNLLLKVSEDK